MSKTKIPWIKRKIEELRRQKKPEEAWTPCDSVSSKMVGGVCYLEERKNYRKGGNDSNRCETNQLL